MAERVLDFFADLINHHLFATLITFFLTLFLWFAVEVWRVRTGRPVWPFVAGMIWFTLDLFFWWVAILIAILFASAGGTMGAMMCASGCGSGEPDRAPSKIEKLWAAYAQFFDPSNFVTLIFYVLLGYGLARFVSAKIFKGTGGAAKLPLMFGGGLFLLYFGFLNWSVLKP